MNTQTTQKSLPIYRGELALLLAVAINSFGVVLMLYSGTGISAISSVPYAFSCVFPKISLGTWTYIFQGLLVLALMILRKKFVVQYLFSFVVGFVFGELLDVHELWINVLPTAIGWRIFYFIASYILICIGIAIPTAAKCLLSLLTFSQGSCPRSLLWHIQNQDQLRCNLPDVTAALTGFGLGHIKGLGIGTVVAAFTMGKASESQGTGWINIWTLPRFLRNSRILYILI